MKRFNPWPLLPLFMLAVNPSQGEEKEAIQIPTLSKFRSDLISRDPFERIDAKWLTDQSSVVAAVDAGPDAELVNLFRVTAIVIDRLAIAVINRKAFAENESFRLKTSGKERRVTVRKVRDGFVELDCDGSIFTVPVVKQVPKLLLDE